MNKLWKILNNKKTNIGAVLLLSSVVMTKLSAIWGLEYDSVLKLIETIEYLGMLFSGVGLTHKGVKILNLQSEELVEKARKIDS